MALRMTIAMLAMMASVGVATSAAIAADNAPAPTTPGGKAVLVRQGHYKELNAAFRAINEELRKDAPDKALIAANAGKMKALAADLPGWFPKGSGPEAGVKTAAKAEIWTDAAGFDAAVSGLRSETAKLDQLAAAADLDALKAEVRAAGGACKTCHDKFRDAEKPAK